MFLLMESKGGRLLNHLNTVSGLVKDILTEDTKARNTDNYLYLKVLEHYSGLKGMDVNVMTVPTLLEELDRCNLPGFETVRRSRQKVQAAYPELAPSENVSRNRRKTESVYRKLSLIHI